MSPLTRLTRFLSSTEAATAVEYAVMLGLILLAAFTTIVMVGQQTAACWSGSAGSIDTAFNGGS